jgi:acyl carrier protein
MSAPEFKGFHRIAGPSQRAWTPTWCPAFASPVRIVVRRGLRRSIVLVQDWVERGRGMDLNTALRESIATICAVPESAVLPTATLKELGIDSLAAAEIITDVEIRTGVELPMDILRGLGQLQTVGQVMEHLQGSRPGPPAPSHS